MRVAILFLLTLSLAGCFGIKSTPLINPPPPAPAATAQVAVRTLVPEATDTAALAATIPAATVYPLGEDLGGGVEPPAYPYPVQGAGETTGGNSAAAFHDCVLTPGLAGCGQAAFALSGRLALNDRSAVRVVVLDLASGAGWQVPYHPENLEWAPAGDKLLLEHQTEGGAEHQLRNAQGQQLVSPQGDALLTWQGPDLLAEQNTLVGSADTSEFRLELAAGLRWLLHARLGGGKEQTLPVDENPADRQYLLLDRVPGDGRLLAQRYSPSNLGLSAGAELILIDPSTGKVEPLNLSAPIGKAASLAWSPAEPALLAFLSSGAEPGMTGLTLYDFAKGERRDSLPAGVQVYALDWRPDGKQLALAAEPLAGVISVTAQKIFPAAGIYLLDPQTGAVSSAETFPTGSGEGWVRWTADSKALIIAQVRRDSAGVPTVDVRALNLDSRREVLLASGLALADGISARVDWHSLLDYAP